MNYRNTDCLTFLKSLPTRSVDSIIVDPPYYRVVADKWDKQWPTKQAYFDWCEQWIEEVSRVAKFSATFWIFGYAYQLGRLISVIEENNFEFRQQITLDKGIKAITGRSGDKLKMFPTASEYVHYYNFNSKDEIQILWNEVKDAAGISKVCDANALLNRDTNGGATWSCVASYGKSNEHRVYPTEEDWNTLSGNAEKYLGKPLPYYGDYVYHFNLPRGVTDVWSDINFYADRGNKFHSTQKPLDLMERIIKATTNKGDIVLDFFGGSGSTGVICEQLDREYWGCEIDPEYYHKSLNRIKNARFTA